MGDRADLFIEEGAKIEFATLNCQKGKIYIGKDAEVMEGSHLRGPIALCEHATVNMGAKLYGATTIGPYSKVFGLQSFGFSAPYKVLDEKLGYTGKNVYEQVKSFLTESLE